MAEHQREPLNLYCLFFGDDPNRIFSVEIAKTKSIADLKKAIKDENQVTLQHVDADTLEIFSVSIPIPIPTDDHGHNRIKNLMTRPLEDNPEEDIFHQRQPVERLGNIFPSLEVEHIHVLVKVPLKDFLLDCLVFGDDPRHIFLVEIAVTKTVGDLKKAIKEKKEPVFDHLPADALEIFKVSIPIDDDDLDTNLKRQNLDNTKSLPPVDRLTSFFSDPLPKRHIHILVKASSVAVKGGLEQEEANRRKLRFREVQELYAQDARTRLAPSSAAAIPAFLNEQSKLLPVLNGRPYKNHGLPVGLFHPVFNSFCAAMTSREPIYSEARRYSAIREFFCAAANIYAVKKERVEAIDMVFPTLLGANFLNVTEGNVQSDGVMVTSCGPYNVFFVVREVKNEIGTAHADPYNQASFSYRSYWSAESLDKVRRASYCPSIVLAIAGPWMCVLGAVYLDKVVLQPLTDYVWLGGDAFDHNRLTFASRLFYALEASISTLQNYYRDLGSNLDALDNQLTDPFPFCTTYGTTKFKYLSRLAEGHSTKLIYKAELENDGRLVVVKFVSKYNAEAHRILAEQGLAPELHYAGTEDENGSLYGGRYMIVMDFVDGSSAPRSLTEAQSEQVKDAMELLHASDLVFGDLRAPNIMICKDTEEVMMIDFDWCGKAGEARYPAELNTCEGIKWADGVGPDVVMTKEHDRMMLAILCPNMPL